MMDEPRKARIRLELSERQKEQIRKATGRKVNSLELRLRPLPEVAEPPTGKEEGTDEARGRPEAEKPQ
jgi:hypothetical protein